MRNDARGAVTSTLEASGGTGIRLMDGAVEMETV